GVFHRVSVAVHADQWIRLPAPYPVPFWLQRVSLLRWVTLTMAHHTFACAVHRCLLDGIPGERLPGSAVYPRFRPLRTSRRSGGYAVTPAPGGRGFHPHGNLSLSRFMVYGMLRLWHHDTVTGGTTHGPSTVCRCAVSPDGVSGFHQPDPRRVSPARSIL